MDPDFPLTPARAVAMLRQSVQRSFALPNRRSALLVAAVLLLMALAGGALIVGVHPAVAVALPLALGAGLLLLSGAQWGLYATLAMAILLPFAALPVSIGFKPTFLDVTLAATFFVWIMSILAGRVRGLTLSPLGPWLIAFATVAVVAFVLGLGHASLDRQTLRRFVELMLTLLLPILVVDHARRARQIEGLAAAMMLFGLLSALIGILLYMLPHDLSNGLLNRLAILDYPSGWVLRFILDDPALNQRAISTSVDPNVFGGLMILLTALTAPQIAAPRPILPRWLAIGAAGAMVLALALTFSRGSMVGLVAALTPLMLLRYRRLIPWVLLAALALLLLPQAQSYIGHFIAGLRGEDLATQMRFGEYKDAIELVRRYPWLGVGFSSSPDIDLYIGVSMVYLYIAQQMGLIGLGLYLLLHIVFFTLATRALRALDPRHSRLEPILLGLTSGIFGALVAGIFDHHFFDIAFPHFATLYWLIVGLAMAAMALVGRETSESPTIWQTLRQSVTSAPPAEG